MKNKKVIFTIIGVIIILIIAIVVFLSIKSTKSNNKNNDELGKGQNMIDSQNNEESILSNIELERIAKFLNKKENNGFLLSSYDDVSEVNLYYIISQPDNETTTQETEKYENLTNQEVTTGLYKMTTEEVKNVLIEKFGAQFITTMNTEECNYIEQEDSYYTLCGDNLYTEIICTSGSKVEDEYTVNFKSKEDTGYKIEGTVILSGQDDSDYWFFISNKVVEK